MTPWDLIIWALAAAAAVVILGLAAAVAIAMINGALPGRYIPARNTPTAWVPRDASPIFRGKA